MAPLHRATSPPGSVGGGEDECCRPASTVAGRQHSGPEAAAVEVPTDRASALNAASKPLLLAMISPRPPRATMAIDRPVSMGAQPPCSEPQPAGAAAAGFTRSGGPRGGCVGRRRYSLSRACCSWCWTM